MNNVTQKDVTRLAGAVLLCLWLSELFVFGGIIIYIFMVLPLFLFYLRACSKLEPHERKSQWFNMFLMASIVIVDVIAFVVVDNYESYLHSHNIVYSENPTNVSGYITYYEVLLYVKLIVATVLVIIFFVKNWMRTRKTDKIDMRKTEGSMT